MATYDLHQHLWPEPFVAALRARTNPPLIAGEELVTIEGGFPIALEAHDPAKRIRKLDRDGIDVAVLSLQPSLGLGRLGTAEREELEDVWCDGAQEIVESSDERLLAFSPTRPRVGFSGVSVGSSTLLDLDTAAPVLDAVDRMGLLLFVHPDAGRPAEAQRPPWWEWAVGYPAQMQAAYLAWLAAGRERWPGVRVLFGILAGGAPFQLERLAHRGVDVRSALDPNVFFDIATYGRRAIELCVETFGVTQLVYGSDVPVVEPDEGLRAVRGFGDSVTHILQTENPTRLLP